MLTLQKRDDSSFGGIAAHLSSSTILTTDVRVPIEAGDKLIRTLANGLRIGCIVEDPGYHPALGSIPERYEIKARRSAPIDSLESPDFWRGRRSDFEALSNHQRGVLGIDPDHPKWLQGSCSYLYDAQHSNCDVTGGLDPEFQHRFADVATQSAIALGCPPGGKPELFWVTCLCLDILQDSEDGGRSELMLSVIDGGIFRDLLRASVAYCSRLARKAEIRALGSNSTAGTGSAEQSPPAQVLVSQNILNEGAMGEDYDPTWALRCDGRDSEKRRQVFGRLARRSVVALGLKFDDPIEALDAWLNRLHKFHWGLKTRFGGAHWRISHVAEAAAEYCAELSTRFHEAENSDSEGKFSDLDRQFRELEDPDSEFVAIRRRDTCLRRDRYPSTNWLHDHAHETFPDPKKELEYWSDHIWGGYQARIEHWDRLDRTGPAWAALPKKLKDAAAGLSYDLAVLQANHAIDRGLRGGEAMQEFQVEGDKLLAQILDAVRASWRRLGLAVDDTAEGTGTLAEPFDRVRDDLRKLLPDLPPASLQLATQLDGDRAIDREQPPAVLGEGQGGAGAGGISVGGKPSDFAAGNPTDAAIRSAISVAADSEPGMPEAVSIPLATQPTFDSGSPRKDEPVSRFGIAGGGSIFSLGGVGGTPTVLPQREFPETRHSLPAASEELKQEVRLLAQESIILITRGSSNPLKGVDDWLDRLQSEGHSWDQNMEALLIASRDHLRRMRVYELGIGNDEKGGHCGVLSERFEGLRVRFFGKDSASGIPAGDATAPQPAAEGDQQGLSGDEAGKKRGRRRDQKRWDAIQTAMSSHGDDWRNHLGEIFQKLDDEDIGMGDFYGKEIDLGDGQSMKASQWKDLDFADGEQRRQIIDALRKYID